MRRKYFGDNKTTKKPFSTNQTEFWILKNAELLSRAISFFIYDKESWLIAAIPQAPLNKQSLLQVEVRRDRVT